MSKNGLPKAANLLSNPDRITPIRRNTIPRKLYGDFNIRLPPCSQTSDLGKSPALLDGWLESAARTSDVSQKPEHIEEVGLTGSVGADQKNALLKAQIQRTEVSPVLQRQARDNHRECSLYPDATGQVGMPELPGFCGAHCGRLGRVVMLRQSVRVTGITAKSDRLPPAGLPKTRQPRTPCGAAAVWSTKRCEGWFSSPCLRGHRGHRVRPPEPTSSPESRRPWLRWSA